VRVVQFALALTLRIDLLTSVSVLDLHRYFTGYHAPACGMNRTAYEK
jgi:hypothetical protein